MWLGVSIIFIALSGVACSLWSQRRVRQLRVRLADNICKLEHCEEELTQLKSDKIKSDMIINQDLERRNQLLSSLNLLLEKVSELDGLISQQMSTVNDAVSRVSQESQTSQYSGEQALQSVELGHEGLPKLNRVLEEFTRMDTSLQKLHQLIQSVSAHSDTIDRIAAESRILSLNASIEAARAGEQGRGFAVVAGSVTDLATKSADSAGLINNISLEGESMLEQLLSNSSEVIQQTEHLLGDFSSVYQQIEQNMANSNSANANLQGGFLEFQ